VPRLPNAVCSASGVSCRTCARAARASSCWHPDPTPTVAESRARRPFPYPFVADGAVALASAAGFAAGDAELVPGFFAVDARAESSGSSVVAPARRSATGSSWRISGARRRAGPTCSRVRTRDALDPRRPLRPSRRRDCQWPRSPTPPIKLAYVEGDLAGTTTIWSEDGKRVLGIIEYRQHLTRIACTS
jgi:hypothetical protein